MTTEVRLAAPGDDSAIAEAVTAAFGTAREAGLVAALRDAGALAVSLVATTPGGVVGHVALSPVTVDGADGKGRWLGLAPLAVLPAWRRRGIGAGLVRAALAGAASGGGAVVFVLGRSSYYGALGFEPAATHGWRCAYDVPAAAFRAHRIGPGAWLPPPGTVTYHPAFAAL